ncbi:exopolysaccharide phosphotransferase [Ceratobasidium sp. AG-Ba]|nr:exopolysaccharide phosphotransferase [Ceratobasidium sp. AG-Ba]
MDLVGWYAILNSRLLTIILLFNVGFISILLLTSELPHSLGVVLEERLSEYHYYQDTDEVVAPGLTHEPVVSDPSPEWLINALNDDDLPCQNLPPPMTGRRFGYSYPPSTSPRHLSLQSKYLPFQRQTHPPPPPSLHDDSSIAESCVDSALSAGALCSSSRPTTLDVVWTFANGSGVLHEKWRRVREVQQRLQRAGTLAPRARAEIDRLRTRPMAGTEKKLFRDHDELRHSMRSVLQHFRQYTTQFHLVTSDFAFPSCNPDEFAGWRLGQIPQWLDLHRAFRWKDGNVRLNVVHHAEFFDREYKYTTFNSLAIESQFAHLNVSDAFIYLNDDFYFSADLSPWDFHTPSYGIVLRMQPDLLVSPLVDGARPSSGEWHSLEFSNRLLSDRFGSRHRPYVIHEAKAFRRSILTEISLIWAQELAATSSHPFRTDPQLRDAHIGFVAAHFIVERWREGLLWSWVVARLGGANDEWDAITSERAWMELGGGRNGLSKRLVVELPKRDSLSEERLEEAAAQIPGQHPSTRSTKYSFTSQDGYPYTFLGTYGWRHWPQFSKSFLQCQIEFDICFPSDLSNASDVFKHIAFVAPKCGDCIINALVAASGTLGLSAFLPNPIHGLKSTQESAQDPVPHLPLVSDYHTGDFSLRGVLGDSAVDIRAWTVRMLQRYRFVIGSTPSIFAMVKDVTTAAAAFSTMELDPSVALVCLNDDIFASQAEATDKTLRREQERRWPHAAAWET